MSENIHQVFVANPITSNTGTDLMYFGQSPYSSGDDAAMTYTHFAAQFANPGDNTNITSMTGLTGTLSAPSDMKDESGNVLMSFNYAANAVCSFVFTNAPTGEACEFGVTSSDSFTDLIISTKNGAIQFADNTGTRGGYTRWLSVSDHYTGFSVAANQSVDVDFILPAADGLDGYVLTTDGAGNLSFQPQTGGGVTAADVQKSAFNIGVDSGIADAYVVTCTPAITSYTDGLTVMFRPANDNATSAPTLDAGNGALPVYYNSSPLIAGDFSTSAGMAICQYSSFGGGQWNILNPSSSLAIPTVIAESYFTFGIDSGSGGNYVVTIPSSINLTTGLRVQFIAASTSQLGSTLNVNGQGAIAIHFTDTTPITFNAMQASGFYDLMFDGATFQVLNPSVTPVNLINQVYTYGGADTGVANAYIITVPYAANNLTGYTDGMKVSFLPQNQNTGASTVNVNGFGVVPIVLNDNTPLVGGEFNANSNSYYELVYSNGFSSFILINPSTGLLSTPNIVEFPGGTSGTYTPSVGCRWYLVRGWAGGGGGGCSITGTLASSAGAGGGGGGYFEHLQTTPVPVSYSFGIGGAGGTLGGAGANGGTTTFDVYSVAGGAGGAAPGSATTPTITSGFSAGGQGIGSTANILNQTGGSGYCGPVYSATQAASGLGGISFAGSGGIGITAQGDGQPANDTGCGGGGALTLNGGAAKDGGDGFGGLIEIVEYF